MAPVARVGLLVTGVVRLSVDSVVAAGFMGALGMLVGLVVGFVVVLGRLVGLVAGLV